MSRWLGNLGPSLGNMPSQFVLQHEHALHLPRLDMMYGRYVTLLVDLRA